MKKFCIVAITTLLVEGGICSATVNAETVNQSSSKGAIRCSLCKGTGFSANGKGEKGKDKYTCVRCKGTATGIKGAFANDWKGFMKRLLPFVGITTDGYSATRVPMGGDVSGSLLQMRAVAPYSPPIRPYLQKGGENLMRGTDKATAEITKWALSKLVSIGATITEMAGMAGRKIFSVVAKTSAFAQKIPVLWKLMDTSNKMGYLGGRTLGVSLVAETVGTYPKSRGDKTGSEALSTTDGLVGGVGQGISLIASGGVTVFINIASEVARRIFDKDYIERQEDRLSNLSYADGLMERITLIADVTGEEYSKRLDVIADRNKRGREKVSRQFEGGKKLLEFHRKTRGDSFRLGSQATGIDRYEQTIKALKEYEEVLAETGAKSGLSGGPGYKGEGPSDRENIALAMMVSGKGPDFAFEQMSESMTAYSRNQSKLAETERKIQENQEALDIIFKWHTVRYYDKKRAEQSILRRGARELRWQALVNERVREGFLDMKEENIPKYIKNITGLSQVNVKEEYKKMKKNERRESLAVLDKRIEGARILSFRNRRESL